MPAKRSPARLIVALSVAAVLAVFLLYTSIAGGGTPSLRPSQLAGHAERVSLAGKVVGQLHGALVMTDVDAAADVARGEEVFTAGIELGGGLRSPYPKGLLIGRVVDFTTDPNEVVQTLFLEPAAPLDRLEFLLVITDYEGGILGPIETGVPCDPTDGGTLPDSDEPCPTDAPRGTDQP